MAQGYAVWKLRKTLRWSRLWPFLLGSAVAVAVGKVILVDTPATPMRMVIGAFLVLYGIYSLLRPTAHRVAARGAIVDASARVFNGIVHQNIWQADPDDVQPSPVAPTISNRPAAKPCRGEG